MTRPSRLGLALLGGLMLWGSLVGVACLLGAE